MSDNDDVKKSFDSKKVIEPRDGVEVKSFDAKKITDARNNIELGVDSQGVVTARNKPLQVNSIRKNKDVSDNPK